MATVEKRSDTSYRITVSCGYDTSGKQIRKKKTIALPNGLTEKQQQKEVQMQSVLFEREVQSGTYLDGDEITFSEFAQKWLADYAEKELAPKTVERYKSLLYRINQALGGLKLCRIQPPHITAFMNNLAESGVRDDCRYILNGKYIAHFKENKESLSKIELDTRTVTGILKGKPTNKKTACTIADFTKVGLLTLFSPQNITDKLSSQTLMHHYRLLNTILHTAVQWNLLLNNPVERTKPPRVEQHEAESLNGAEITVMLKLMEDVPLKYQAAVSIAVFGGLRVGEVLALRWADMDFETGKLSITKSRQYLKGKGCFEKAPKNESSKRELKLPKIALLKLGELKKEQTLQRLALGGQWIDDDNVFTQWNGTPMRPNTVSHWFTKWIAKTDLPQITFHGLRHSNASLLIAYGTNIATVSKRLGHSRISTTSDIYTHAISKMDEEAASTLDSIFTPKKAILAI